MAIVLAEGQSESKGCWQYYGNIPDKKQEFLENIRQKKDPNFVNCYGISALAIAVRVFQSPQLAEELLGMGADPNKDTYIGRFRGKRRINSPSGSPLHVAAWINDIKILQLLLSCRANPNAVSSKGLTPLQYVLVDSYSMGERPGSFSEKGALNAIKILIAHGADVTGNSSLLHLAAKRGYCTIVQHLLTYKGVDMDWRDSEGKTPLMTAVKGNFCEIVQILIARGADLNLSDVNGYTALHYAESVEIAVILLQHGVEVNAKNNAGDTALHFAGNVERARTLLQHGADVNPKNNTGQTALLNAVQVGLLQKHFNYELIKCLLEYNANVNVADNYGFRPLHLTVRGRKKSVDTSLVKILTDNGADPFLPDGVGRIPLSYFTAWDSDNVVRQISLLLPQTENTRYSTDIFGKPPLFNVLSYFMKRSEVLSKEPPISQFKDVIHAVLRSGIAINCQDIGDATCLHVVAANDLMGLCPYSRCGLIQALIGFGADRNLKDVDGNSPAHIAAEKENFDELRLLVAGNWRDSCNLKGETVQGILNRKISKSKDHHEIARFNNIVDDVKDIMEDLRLEQPVKIDVVDTLNEKIPEAYKAVGFENILTYPAPMVRTLRAKGIYSSPEKEHVVTSILQSIAEEKAAVTYHERASDERDHSVKVPWQLQTPLLWKEGETCQVAAFADRLIWEHVKKKRRGLSPEDYIPPAPNAVKHIIRGLPKACRDSTVGEFHFGEEECSHERCEIGRQVRELVNDLVLIMEDLDPRFQCKLHLTGSVPEKTKLWKPDEFDFMMELTKLKGHCRVRFLEGHPGRRQMMVVINKEVKQIWGDLMTSEFVESTDFLSPTKFRDYFVLLAWRAGFSLKRTKYKNLSFSLSQYCEGRESLPLVRFSQVGVLLHMQWHGREYPSLDIEVDLTPSVPFSDWPEQLTRVAPSHPSLYDKNIGFHAITAIKTDGAFWRLSFSLIELNLIHKLPEGQIELYKAFKLLRDIHMKEGATPSFALKSIVLNYVYKENAVWSSSEPNELAFHVVHLLRRLEQRRTKSSSYDKIVKSFFTDDILPDVQFFTVSTDWVRLSLLEFKKELIPSGFWLEGAD